MPLTVHILAFIILGVFIVNKYRQYNRLKAFTGPFSTGWSELWHTYTIWSNKSHLAYMAVSERYGRIARIGPNELLTSSPELLVHMSAVRSPYTRTAWYNMSTRVRPGKDHVFSQVDEGRHTKRRQQMASGYSGRENLNLESDVDTCVHGLIKMLRTKYLSTDSKAHPFDFAQKIQYLALDVISTVGFGEPFGMVDMDSDVNDYVKSAEEGLAIVTFVGAFGLARYLQWPPLARLLGPTEGDAGGLGRMMFNARKIIDFRLTKSIQDRSDMMASFMRHGLTRDDLLTESLLQIVAGSDTTATTLRVLMLHVITHPRVYIRLQKEVDSITASSNFSPTTIVVPDATLKTMPYLQAVVREGLRVHPPVTDVVPKKVPSNGDTVVIDGKEIYLPGGTDISYSVWSVHHDKTTFGDDADLFRPERWLLDEEGDYERLTNMRRTTELIFGYGKYQCLGKPIAWMEITKALFEFMRHFDWALATPETPWESSNYYGFFVQKKMWATISERRIVT